MRLKISLDILNESIFNKINEQIINKNYKTYIITIIIRMITIVSQYRLLNGLPPLVLLLPPLLLGTRRVKVLVDDR